MLSFTTLLPLARRMGRWLIAGCIGLALVGAVWGSIHSFGRWRDAEAARSYAAGEAAERSRWQQAQVAAYETALARAEARQKAAADAMISYVRRIAERQPRVTAITKEVIRYVESDMGRGVCLDAGGVQLIRAHRAAQGFPDSAQSGPVGRGNDSHGERTVPLARPAAGGAGRADEPGAGGGESADR